MTLEQTQVIVTNLQLKTDNILAILERQQTIIDMLITRLAQIDIQLHSQHRTISSQESYIAGQLDRNSGR